MNAMQMNAEIYRQLAIIAEDESKLAQAARYLKKLATHESKKDETLMTKEEFFAKIDRSLEQYRRGEYRRFDNKEEMHAWLNSL